MNVSKSLKLQVTGFIYEKVNTKKRNNVGFVCVNEYTSVYKKAPPPIVLSPVNSILTALTLKVKYFVY